jgi:Protein of unknown function (DUF5818)
MASAACDLEREMLASARLGRNENGRRQFNPTEVLVMRSTKHNLFDLSILGAMALAFALAWGSPFVAGGSGSAHAQDQAQPQQQPDHAQPPQTQPDQNQAQTGTFTGTVVKDGSDFLLRDSSGAIFKLDDAKRAKPFEGKTVKVTGELDEQAKVIHVESIEGAEA